MHSCQSQTLKRSNHSSPGKLVVGRPLQSTLSLPQFAINASKPVHLLKLKPKRDPTVSISTASPKLRTKRKSRAVKEVNITVDPPVRVVRRRSPKRASRKEEAEAPALVKSTSPQVQQLILQSVQRTVALRNEAARRIALSQQAKADRQERLKKKNEAIRKKNSLKRGKPAGALHQSAWGVDQRRCEPADVSMAQLKAKKQKEREKMHRAGRERIGMAHYKLPKPKQVQPSEEPQKSLKSSNQVILK